ncbi:hypothetical protein [Roseisolibacter sp. H3M3-2]|uniref:hypothetical protein n=1 Tax=Roseisolibacter sp. H3M3-2 TaxID=3031323 RepID=UPI0023DCAC61|nr:hypothetical protein [Roseisolibacter sp. H3M3-2]MDF1502484.1 hypothetical protein [Roseisolibacter sp. H3M3-2]
MRPPRALPSALASALLCAACASAPGAGAGAGAGAPLPAAPWSGARLTGAEAPAVYGEQWRRAANRATCALLAPRTLGEGAGATPRAATYSGGWAVAYDRPGLRSAFGVAGSGSPANGDTYAWADSLRWADGSVATYGPEGGTGPNQLAYLRVAGQGCLYNVWSRLGRAHLVTLLGALRFVE